MNQDSCSSIPPSPIRSRRSRISGNSTYITQSSSYSIPNQRRKSLSSMRVLGGIYTFGKDSPKWTIPSSRPQKVPHIQSPGPGQYNLSSSLIDDKRIYQRMSLTSHEKSRPPLTASIGFIDRPSLINKNSGIVIGKRDTIDFAKTAPNPGPGAYSPQTNLNSQSHVIASRHGYDHSGDIPGPGSYDISRSILATKGGSLPGSISDRAQWMTDGIEKTPGPSDYSPNIMLEKKRSKMKKKNVIAIDRCIVKLNNVENPIEAKKYLQTNHKLKEIINEIYQVLLYSKPDKPLQFIREYFLPEAPPPPPMEEEEEEYLLH
ncbi:hypothetical protein M9Y10_002028 [Tritrichomonas musculus]|uniref:RIIa domain-containing protein n=1 Tax=Tritrichomonas musculus TaxID=1915356 RepID=A0ABR2L9Q6_9EUKA